MLIKYSSRENENTPKRVLLMGPPERGGDKVIMARNRLRRRRARDFIRAMKKQRKRAKLLITGKGKDKDRAEIVDPGAS